MKKRIVSLLLVLVMLLTAFASCKPKPTPTPDGGDTLHTVLNFSNNPYFVKPAQRICL